MARALQKRVIMISIDGSLPPSYAQDVQMEMISRYRSTRPWLTPEEALVECVLQCAQPTGEDMLTAGFDDTDIS